MRLSLAAVVLAWTCWAAYAHAIPYVASHDYFRLRTIRISSDETRVAPQALAEVAGLYDDQSLWDIDPDRIRDTLRDASWVKHAEVARHFPWQVSLSVSRRHAVAAAVATNKAFLVDEDGVLFHEIEEASVADLPYLTGWDQAESQKEAAGRLRALLGVLGEAAGRQVEVSELHMDEDGTVWLYGTTIKASVRLGDASRAGTGLDRLAIALAELGPLADRARIIDTDYRDRIVIRGADDKLPAMLAAQAEKANAPMATGGETEVSNSPASTGSRATLHDAAASKPRASSAGRAKSGERAAAGKEKARRG